MKIWVLGFTIKSRISRRSQRYASSRQCHQDFHKEKDVHVFQQRWCLLERWEVFAASTSQIEFTRLGGGEQALKTTCLNKLCPSHGSWTFSLNDFNSGTKFSNHIQSNCQTVVEKLYNCLWQVRKFGLVRIDQPILQGPCPYKSIRFTGCT